MSAEFLEVAYRAFPDESFLLLVGERNEALLVLVRP
jgi:hypothetical protein